MYKLLNKIIFLSVLLVLSACVAKGDRKLVKPLEKMAAPYDNGSIFKVGFNERPLYEERRARNVGDGLIMTVPSVADAAKKDEKKDEGKDKTADNGDSSDDSRSQDRRRRGEEDDLSNIASEALVGKVPMTVINVLDNGYLYVAGGKQVTVGDQDKYVRITGVVDPANITGGNLVQSTTLSEVSIQIDDLRIRSDGTATNFTEGQSTFGNYFQSIRP